jgi:hydrogenase small subunit
VAAALEKACKPVLVWLQFQDCAGNSESILRSGHPSVLEVVLDLFSWEYHELVMAGAGHQAEAALERVVREEKGKFLAVVEGAVPLADDGVYCTVGGRSALDIARHVCPNAAATIAAGACAWDGGLVRAHPNPTGAVGISEAVPEANVIGTFALSIATREKKFARSFLRTSQYVRTACVKCSTRMTAYSGWEFGIA